MDQTPLALAAVGYSDGLRAFVHSGDGKIRVVGNEAEVDDILSSTHSKNSKDGKWEPGTLRASCSTQSNLAAFEGQDGLILGLCYQLPDGTLALYHRDYKWRPVTGFTGIQKARPGTALVTVSSHIARRVVLFFQDEKDYVSCRRATWQETDWVWESAVRLAEAVPGCGIAATSWKRDEDEGLEEIGLYYQDAHSQTVELRLSFSACGPSDARSAPIEPIPVKEAQRSISMQVLAAASYGSPPDIRLFLREDRNVWEFQRGRDSERLWHRQSVNLKDFAPRSNLAALARTSGDSDRVVIDLLYWSANEALNHKLFVHRRGWQDTTSVGPPPVITPPQSTDPHDLAYSENAIRFEASSDLIGIRDALWTLEGHAKWLKIDLVAKKLKRDLLEALCEAASEVSKRAFDSEPLERIIQHIATLGNLAIRLSRLHEGDDPARNDLLQQCKVQAARVETAIEAWPNMCKALHSSIKVAELNTDNMPLGNAGAFEDRLDDIREVISSTYNRGVEMLSEQMDKAVAADNRLDAAIKTRDDARQRAAEMKGFRAVGRVLTLGLTVIFEQVSGLNDDIETQLNAARAADRQAVRYREERDKAMEDGRSLLLAFARVEKWREDLDLDKIRLLVRLNSANEKQLRRKVVASKTCADHTAKCFSTLLVQSTTLPLQSSAEGFARALLDMLKIFDGSDAPDGFRAHVRHSGDLRRRLEAIAA